MKPEYNKVGRYLLVFIDHGTKDKYYINIKQKNIIKNTIEEKNKVFLQTIDRGTTRFETEKELINYLYNIGQIPSNNGTITIEYQSNNTTKNLDVIYNDQTNLKYLSIKYQYNKRISSDDKVYLKIGMNFIKEISNELFYSYVKKSEYLNDYVKAEIKAYVRCKSSFNDDERRDAEEALSNILFALTNYKTIRGVVLLTNNFNLSYRKNKIDDDFYEERAKRYDDIWSKCDLDNLSDIEDDQLEFDFLKENNSKKYR